MNPNEPVPLYIQDVIEILTNIKLKHGNLPVYGFDRVQGVLYQMAQDNVHGIHYKEEFLWDGIPERVEIT